MYVRPEIKYIFAYPAGYVGVAGAHAPWIISFVTSYPDIASQGADRTMSDRRWATQRLFRITPITYRNIPVMNWKTSVFVAFPLHFRMSTMDGCRLLSQSSKRASWRLTTPSASPYVLLKGARCNCRNTTSVFPPSLDPLGSPLPVPNPFAVFEGMPGFPYVVDAPREPVLRDRCADVSTSTVWDVCSGVPRCHVPLPLTVAGFFFFL